MASIDSPKVDGWNAASYEPDPVSMDLYTITTLLTEAASISASVGGFPLGPFLDTYSNLLRQYLAITSIRPSCWCVAWLMNDLNDGSKFFDGGNVTSSTHSSCHPRNTLSLRT